MRGEDKTKKRLVNELGSLRQRVAELETLETARKETEEALRECEEKYHTLAESAQDQIFIIDRDSRIQYSNPFASKQFGFHPKKIIGKHFKEVFPPESFNVFQKNIQTIFESGEPLYVEDKITFFGKELWLDTRLTPLKKEGGEVKSILGISRDITERKRLEKQLLQSQKMESIGRLAGGVAHDFNNILTSITGYSELLLSSLKDTGPLCEDVKEIIKSARRAALLTQQLLTFSHKQLLQPRILDLNTLVNNIRNMLHSIIGADIELVTILEPALVCMKADPVQIERVIMNLAINARDAMPDGGKLTLKTKNVVIDREFCKVIPDSRPGKFLCLSIEDTGEGMDKETVQHIFEPFFSTKRTGKGNGLGLSVVYGIVKQHEGWINVYSEPGQDSAFNVYLPASSMKPEDANKEAIPLQRVQGGGEGILLVEDEESVRKAVTRILNKNGYLVFNAANAEEALEIFEREKRKISLIFSDVVLPDKNGVQLVNELLDYNPKLHILLSSGYTDNKSQLYLMREKRFRFLQKPYTLTHLLRIVREAMEVI